MSTRADSLLHPVRLRIVTAVARLGQASTRTLARALPDVPQASLYRHVRHLREHGLLHVAPEKDGRDALYTVGDAVLGDADLDGASAADLSRYFVTFLASLLRDFDAYATSSERGALSADRVGFRTTPLWLSDAEFDAMVAGLNAVMGPLVAQGPGPERKLRHFSTVVLPMQAPEGPEQAAPDSAQAPPDSTQAPPD